MWVNLNKTEDTEMWRGAVFRMPATNPYEDIVDLMLIEDKESESGLSLVVSTGYKAGIKLISLPNEARSKSNSVSLSKEWLVTNWNKWIYESCKVEDVLYIKQYPSKI